MVETETNTLLQRVREVLVGYPSVQAAYLFGSHARGGAAPGSDLDIGLVGPRDELQARKLDLLTDLTAAGVDRVDLVLLDGADTVLRFEVVSRNCLVYGQEGFDHGSYFSRALREYFDHEPYLRIQREALKRRLLHGQA